MVSLGDLQTETFLFFRTGITHINLLSFEVVFEMQKVLKTRLPKPFISPSFKFTIWRFYI